MRKVWLAEGKYGGLEACLSTSLPFYLRPLPHTQTRGMASIRSTISRPTDPGSMVAARAPSWNFRSTF